MGVRAKYDDLESDQAQGVIHKRLFHAEEIVLPTEYTVEDVLEEAHAPAFREDERYQAEVMCRAQSLWPAFTKQQEESFAINAIPHIRRFRDDDSSTDTKWRLLHRIMRLPSDATVRAALEWNPAEHIPYEPESWEEGYMNLPGFVGRFVDTFKESTHPAPFFAWAALALIGVACKWNIYTPIGGYELLNNFYLFFVGEKGAGKSYASDCMQRVLGRLNERLNTPIRVSQLDEPPVYHVMNRPDLWLNKLPQDGTMESIVERLHAIRQIPVQEVVTDGANGTQSLKSTGRTASASGCLFVDEVSEQFGRDDWHSAKKIAAYTSMATSDSRARMTIGRGDRSYDQQAFSMMVCGAVEWFRGAVSPQMLEGGFMDRSMFIYRQGTERIYTAFEMPTVDPVAVERLAEELIALAVAPSNLRRPMELTPGAKEELIKLSRREFKQEKAANADQRPKINYRATAIRREHMKIKVAACLAISDSLGRKDFDEPLELRPIKIEHIKMADWLVTSEDPAFDRFLREVNVSSYQHFYRMIYAQVLKAKWGWIRESDLFREAQRDQKIPVNRKKDFADLMQVLQDAALVEADRVAIGKNVRPVACWRGIERRNEWNAYTS